MNASNVSNVRPLSFSGAAFLMILATMLWGVSFVAPLMLSAYSPVQITFGRFFFYGVVSAVLLFGKYRTRRLGLRAWATAAVYGFTGNILFSVLVSFGVQDTGAEVVIPLIGLLPICVSVAGSRGLPTATWRRLALPFAMVTCGLALVLLEQSGLLVRGAKISWPGVLAVVVTVIVWTWYAISNANFLRANPSISGAHWSCAIGVATFALSIVMVTIDAAVTRGPMLAIGSYDGRQTAIFLALTLLLGVGASWLATGFFNKASHTLPMGLVGQMIVLETIFGITYVCIYRQTLPPAPQAIGILLAILGIWLSARQLLK
jgi:drug/metabolite transporter (DMT)-like permease